MFKTIDEMIEQSKMFDEHKADWTLPRNQVRYSQDGEIIVPQERYVVEDGQIVSAGGNTSLAFNDWSLGQACYKLGIQPKNIRRLNEMGDDGAKMLLAHNLTYWTEHPDAGNWAGDWFIRGYGDECRAVLSGEYSPLSSTWLLETAKAIIGDNKYKLIRPYLDENSLHLKVGLKDVPDPKGGGGIPYGIGFYLSNGEIGNRSIHVKSFVQRTSCTNSIILGEGYTSRHRALDLDWLEGHLSYAMAKAVGASAETMEVIFKAERAKIPSLTDVLTRISKQYGWSDETRMMVAQGSEGESTHMGLVNGITFAAWHQENPDTMIEMEELGGAILVEPGSVFSKVELAQMYPQY